MADDMDGFYSCFIDAVNSPLCYFLPPVIILCHHLLLQPWSVEKLIVHTKNTHIFMIIYSMYIYFTIYSISSRTQHTDIVGETIV